MYSAVFVHRSTGGIRFIQAVGVQCPDMFPKNPVILAVAFLDDRNSIVLKCLGDGVWDVNGIEFMSVLKTVIFVNQIQKLNLEVC